jgi:hypothetical protein
MFEVRKDESTLCDLRAIQKNQNANVCDPFFFLVTRIYHSVVELSCSAKSSN